MVDKLYQSLLKREPRVIIEDYYEDINDLLKQTYQKYPELLLIVEGYKIGRGGANNFNYEIIPQYYKDEPERVYFIDSTNEMVKALIACTSRYEPTCYMVGKEQLYQELSEANLIMHNPKLHLNNFKYLYIDCIYGYDLYGYKFKIEYTCTREEAIKRKQEMNKEIDHIASLVEGHNYPDYVKAILVIDYAVKNWKYKMRMGKEKYTAHSVLVNHQGVCQGISLAIYAIFNRIGIPCEFITGVRNDKHSWNKVYIQGGWFYIDVTDSICTKDLFFGWGITKLVDRTLDQPDTTKLVCNCPKEFVLANMNVPGFQYKKEY